MKDDSQPDLFELFWENSKLNNTNIREFSARIDEYYSLGEQNEAFLFPGQDHVLPQPKDKQYRAMQKRQSHRKFADKKVSMKQLGSLLAAFAKSPQGSRLFPSAGSTYALEVFCILNNVEGDLNGKIVYYNADNHSLGIVGNAPSKDELKTLTNLDTEGTTPSVIFILTLLSYRTTKKYGERGGRFALIELGHAAQNLGLRLVQEKMVGVEIGGLIDEEIIELLGLKKYSVKVALGYACGFA